MVFCGRPSRACESCRKRRVKCDQLRPACTTCTKAGRQCPGYRDLSDVVFRDESERVISRHERTHSKDVTVSSNNSSNTIIRRPKKKPQPAPSALDLATSLDWKMDDIAINYVLGGCLTGSHFAYMPALYAKSQNKELLHSALLAVGFTTMARRTGNMQLSTPANDRYLKAITTTNEALRSTTLCRKDEVLASIMLLSRYEMLQLSKHAVNGLCSEYDCKTLNCRTHGWKMHVDGALALATLRGEAQFTDPIGIALFKQVGAHVRVHCAQHMERLPEELRRLTWLGQLHADQRDMAHYTRASMVDENLRFMAELQDGSLTDPEEAILRAGKVLACVERTEEMLASDPATNFAHQACSPAPFDPFSDDETQPPDAYEDILGGRYIAYTSARAAQGANTIWMTRLILWGIIDTVYNRGIHPEAFYRNFTAAKSPAEVNAPPDYPFTPPPDPREMSAAALALATAAPINAVAAAHAIAASVPGFFPSAGTPPSHSPAAPISPATTPSSTSSSSPPAQSSRKTAPMSGPATWQRQSSTAGAADVDVDVAKGYLLIWPLFVAGSSHLIPPTTKRYIVSQLRAIGVAARLQEAHDAAVALENGERENWMHLCHVF